jgi:sn-glycerol 3-phosphate transport system ATP-binding protein
VTAKQITLEAVKKSFGAIEVIPGLTTQIRGGEFTIILGPSGCGKTTLLNLLAGLETVTAGKIRFGDREVQGVAAKDRGCAMVFQNYALYPHMSVADNIGYALKLAGIRKKERQTRVAAVAETTGLSEFLGRRPSQLSGGQRQRVAIARAIVREPEVLLFDEPLSNLDAKLRHGMRMELADLHRRLGATSIFVTHDQVEAMTLADRIMLLNKGRIEQFGPPAEIYSRPASVFVAEFIGSPPMNIIEVTRTADGHIGLKDGSAVTDHAWAGACLVGFRPEHIRIVADDEGVAARVVYREDLGSHAIVVIDLPDGQRIQATTQLGQHITWDESIHVVVPDDRLHFFDPQTGMRLDDDNRGS